MELSREKQLVKNAKDYRARNKRRMPNAGDYIEAWHIDVLEQLDTIILHNPSWKKPYKWLKKFLLRCTICNHTFEVTSKQLHYRSSSPCPLCPGQTNRHLLPDKRYVVPRAYISSLKRGAAIREIPWALGDPWFRDSFYEGVCCALSGVPLYFGKKRKPKNASLDRIDSNLGYTPDNVQWVHKDINLMKMSLPNPQFIEYCRMVAKTHPNA